MTARLIRLLTAASVTLFLTACTVFPDTPAHRIFQLSAPVASAGSDEVVDSALRVSAPLAVSPIDTTRILVKPDAREIQAYEGVRWSNRAPVLLGTYFVESFRRDGRLATVVNDTSPARSDVALVGDLTRFQAEYRGGEQQKANPVVHLQLDLQLIDEHTRETLSSRHFEISHQAEGESVESVVEAFGMASRELARQVINWTVEEL